MVAQVDEQQAAVVALAVDPAGEAGFMAGIGGAQGATVVGAVLVHLAGPVWGAARGRADKAPGSLDVKRVGFGPTLSAAPRLV